MTGVIDLFANLMILTLKCKIKKKIYLKKIYEMRNRTRETDNRYTWKIKIICHFQSHLTTPRKY